MPLEGRQHGRLQFQAGIPRGHLQGFRRSVPERFDFRGGCPVGLVRLGLCLRQHSCRLAARLGYDLRGLGFARLNAVVADS